MPNRAAELNAFEEQIQAIIGTTSSLTIVCGAGVSMASVNENLREKNSWLGLIQQGLEFAQALGLNVAEELNQIQTPEQKMALKADQLIELAGRVQKHLQKQEQYENWLAANVGDAVLPDLNKMILINSLAECAKISHVNLATTNYDYLLSRAQGWNPAISDHPNTPISWQDRSGLASWMQDRTERVLHLHGDAYNADSVIFSQVDYDRLNQDGVNGWTARIRSAISTTHVVLFIGCGNTTNDPAFKRILKLYETTLAANRFNTKWFQLAKSNEYRFPNGVKKLTYGDNYDDLPIFVRDTLLPLLTRHLAKTEIGKNETTKVVENNQLLLQATSEAPTLDLNVLNVLAPLRQSVAEIIFEELKKNKVLLKLFECENDINKISITCANADLDQVKSLLDTLQKGFKDPVKFPSESIKKIAGALVLSQFEMIPEIQADADKLIRLNTPDETERYLEFLIEAINAKARKWPLATKLSTDAETLEMGSIFFKSENTNPSQLDGVNHVLNIALQISSSKPLVQNNKLLNQEEFENKRTQQKYVGENWQRDLIRSSKNRLNELNRQKAGVIIDGRTGLFSTESLQKELDSSFGNLMSIALTDKSEANSINIDSIIDLHDHFKSFLEKETKNQS